MRFLILFMFCWPLLVAGTYRTNDPTDSDVMESMVDLTATAKHRYDECTKLQKELQEWLKLQNAPLEEQWKDEYKISELSESILKRIEKLKINEYFSVNFIKVLKSKVLKK